MKNLCVRVIIMIVGVNFSGTMTTPLRKSSIFLNSECQWNGYPRTNCYFAGKRNVPVNISQKENSINISSNFFRILLQSLLEKKEQNRKHLDLRNNSIFKITLSPLVHLHALEILNLSNNAIHSISLDLSKPVSSRVKHHRSIWRNGFPSLKVLILQRNKLSGIPKELWKLKSLQSLDLSFNEISQIALFDFHNCRQLENLYLNSNKIFRIHSGAFESLKKLQVVDLSYNALVTILPMMLIALKLPHLKIGLAGNQWQCDCSVILFQNVLSESWRQKWKGICNRSIGNEEACWGTPPSRIPRETPVNVNPTENSPKRSLHWTPAEMHKRLAKEPQTSDLAGPRRELELHHRRPREIGAVNLAHDQPRSTECPDLSLAVCLSVFITFFLAFGLGALARPYLERLWPGRSRHKRPPPDLVYTNEGFYDEVAGSFRQHPRPDVRDPWQHRKPGGVPASGVPDGIGSRQQDALARDNADPLVLGGQVGPNTIMSEAHEHSARSVETIYDKVAQEESLPDCPSAVPGRMQSVSASVPSNCSEFDPAGLFKEPATPLSAGLMQNEAPSRTRERGPREDAQVPPEAALEHIYMNLPSARQQRLRRSGAGLESSPHCSTITASDAEGSDPSSPPCPPRQGSAQWVMPPNLEPIPNIPHELGINYDSDEGSLFTLSSTDSEDARGGSEDETDGKERVRASDAPEVQDSGLRKDLENQEEDHTLQAIQWGAENQEGPPEKAHLSSPDPDLGQTHIERASDIKPGSKDPWTQSRSQDNNPIREEIPGWVPAPDPETTVWRYSLKDLVVSDEDTAPQTHPLHYMEAPSDLSPSDEGAFKYELDTAPNDRTFKISWDSLGSSQWAFEEGADANEEFV
ncbi:leucine-rich repeat-containing protein 66 [Suncus etruscus]|uniref:leucine-rich repeat-containing protein 66 n=1 Tax=Suncus etruscus TaxID=109475 RepID=UPI002110452B|nr:leucine-rich repeat-containing protein 66 [Suncus etruscus]